MRLLVFAHTPPPFHGQSYMVQVLLEGLGGDWRKKRVAPPPSGREGVHCFHVNARLSDSLEAVGSISGGKLLRLLGYCAEAIFCRFRYGVRIFYYVPAPPKRGAIYRDWIVLALCRPFFPRIIFHWHASGLGTWLERDAAGWERWLTERLASGVELSIVLADALAPDAARLRPRRITVLANGIADPCPDFEENVLPLRRTRAAACSGVIALGPEYHAPPIVYRVLFLANCTREKGLFDAIEAVRIANAQLQQTAPALQMQLTVAGAFVDEAERQEFDRTTAAQEETIDYVGFLVDERKRELLISADCLCFPSYYAAEGQPVSIVEAMAFGLPIVATRWRGIPEMLPAGSVTVPVRDPAALAAALIASVTADTANQLRTRFLEVFSLDAFLRRIREEFELVAAE